MKLTSKKIDYLKTMSIDSLENVYKKIDSGKLKSEVSLLDVKNVLEQKTKQRNKQTFNLIDDFKFDYKGVFVDARKFVAAIKTLHDWLAVFPEAKSIIFSKIKEYKNIMESLTLKQEQLFLQNLEEKKYSVDWLHIRIKQLKVANKIDKCQKIIFYFKRQLPAKKNSKQRGVTDSQIAQAKAIPLELIVGETKRIGINKLRASCPFHEDNCPSLSISTDKNLYYCFVCSKGGTPITYIMNTQNLNFIETVKLLYQYQ